jgi:hypothetical protein
MIAMHHPMRAMANPITHVLRRRRLAVKTGDLQSRSAMLMAMS